ncbi:MAG: tetratricopeptide repeat protein, partial [Muriicola sp.]
MKIRFWSIWGFLLLTAFALHPNIMLAQNGDIDSLKNIVQAVPKDTTKVSALNALCLEYIQLGEFDQAKGYADQAIILAEQLDYKKGRAYALKNKGLAVYYQGKYKDVLENWTQSLQTFEAIKDTLGVANLASNLGAIYYNLGSHARALDYYLKSLDISQKLGDPVR